MLFWKKTSQIAPRLPGTNGPRSSGTSCDSDKLRLLQTRRRIYRGLELESRADSFASRQPVYFPFQPFLEAFFQTALRRLIRLI